MTPPTTTVQDRKGGGGGAHCWIRGGNVLVLEQQPAVAARPSDRPTKQRFLLFLSFLLPLLLLPLPRGYPFLFLPLHTFPRSHTQAAARMCYVCVRTNTLISSFFSSHFSARGGSWEIAACSTTTTYFLFGEEGGGGGRDQEEGNDFKRRRLRVTVHCVRTHRL